VIVVSMIVSATGLVHAEPGPADAVAIGHGALELFRHGDYASALARFQEADAIAHSPVFSLYIARCQRSLGRLLQARKSYRTVLDEVLDAEAPAPWRSAQVDAGAELAELSARIPSIVVEATFAPSAFELDGKPLSLAKLGTELELDPGPHHVTVGSNQGVVERSLNVSEGERGVRILFVEPRARKPGPTATSKPEAKSTDGGPRYDIVVPVALGATALAVGATAGIVALVKTNDLKSRCDGNVCDPEDASLVDPIRSWATVSTVAFAVAGAGFAVGAVFAVTGSGKADTGRRVGLLLSGEL
jgi:hypothetical protein